ncbi:molybdate ABC transporter substrate-binding protein [Rubrivivax gelatinosus]|uniref:Molybdate ABC transporter substrate-binding protein n=1 Tax=Rubrivivax gelatinosus TaxID=28068 RepID=A0ABS1E1Y2_RUBGE|nr:molybdate ABC transporter substrate-binding protein [Rubrivivax gelatinosus]MBK1715853.1 molybdate ABC transporter substrate-binding protein [Rubrivivax gelatinosus]
MNPHTLFTRLRAAVLPLLAAVTLTAHAEPPIVAAGAGYKRPVSELAQAFEARSGHKLELSFGNMAQVLTLAASSGRVALILGDQAFLETAPVLKGARLIPVGEGRLVLAWAKAAPAPARPENVADPVYARIAMPDPAHAVYGKAASEFLQRSGLAATLQPRLITVATVPQVSAYLASGDVDAGFINLTDALGIRERIGGWLAVDGALYSPVRIVAAVVPGHEQQAEVKALEAFLATPEAQALLRRHGL